MLRKLTATVAMSMLVVFTANAGDRDDRRHDRGQRHEQRRDHRSDNRRDHRDDRRDHRSDNRRDHHQWDRRDARRDEWHDNHRDRDRRHDRHDYRRDDRHRYGNHRYVYREPPRYYPRHDYPRYVRHDRYRAGAYYRPYGYRPYRWYAGARLPAPYYAPRYVIYDYPAYRLRPPPYGYHWVRVDNDVVLAAIATGVVLQVVNGIFW
jgi:Ni/Co efflux regulator RcnB